MVCCILRQLQSLEDSPYWEARESIYVQEAYIDRERDWSHGFKSCVWAELVFKDFRNKGWEGGTFSKCLERFLAFVSVDGLVRGVSVHGTCLKGQTACPGWWRPCSSTPWCLECVRDGTVPICTREVQIWSWVGRLVCRPNAINYM